MDIKSTSWLDDKVWLAIASVAFSIIIFMIVLKLWETTSPADTIPNLGEFITSAAEKFARDTSGK